MSANAAPQLLSRTEHPDGFNTFGFTDGTHIVSCGDRWLDGVFESHAAALRAGRQQVGLDCESPSSSAGGSNP